MPQRFYKLLDNLVFRVLVIAFLLNQQIKSPSKAILISTGFVLGLRMFVKVAAPDAPPLSELVHPVDDKNKDGGKDGKPCNCNLTLNLQQVPGATTVPMAADGKGMGWLNEEQAAQWTGMAS